jgi:pimeloyl-ACP methyl ester carboxylesterase
MGESVSEREALSADGTPIGFALLGSGPPLVIVHGSVSTAEHWLGVARHLAGRFTCHVMDRRGRGRSGDASGHAIEREAEDVRAVLDAAGPGAHLLGHSYGAICALEAARKSPPARLVLYEPPLLVGASQAERLATSNAELIARGEAEEALASFLREGPEVPEEEIAVLRTTPIWPQMVAVAPTLTREARAIGRIDGDFERYRGIAVPTLLLVGRLSSKGLQDASRRLEEVLPDARTLCLDGQAHAANMVAPEAVALGVAEFLSSDA